MRADIYIFAVIALAGMWATIAFNSRSHETRERIDLQLGRHTLHAEVVRDHADMVRGLTHRSHLPRYSGMLFIFNESKQHCFLMEKTVLPLSVAFLDSGGQVINMADMEPKTKRHHCASAPARFAIEVNKGLFQVASIKTGSTISGLPGIH